MSAELLTGVLSAFWLGILTSISPCPMATNIAAVSYIGRQIDSRKRVFLAGVLYTIGRALAYSILGFFLVRSMSSLPVLSHFFQKYMNLVLGPVLVFAGMVLLNLISVRSTGGLSAEKIKGSVDRTGIWGAGILGVLFALSFCPASAAIFFGSTIPLAFQLNSSIIIPLFYGIATGLPVMILAGVLAVSAEKASRIFNRVALFQKWAGRITGILFILIGIYFTLIHIFGIRVL